MRLAEKPKPVIYKRKGLPSKPAIDSPPTATTTKPSSDNDDSNRRNTALFPPLNGGGGGQEERKKQFLHRSFLAGNYNNNANVFTALHNAKATTRSRRCILLFVIYQLVARFKHFRVE